MSEAVNSKNIGGWSPFSTPTHEDLNIFNEAMQGNIGVTFTPQQVSTQLVHGMNYKFKCKAITTGTQKPTTLLVMIQIFAPADGSSPSIISNTVINPKPEPTNGNKPSGDKAVQYLANNQWQFQLNQDNDLICLVSHGTGSGKVEIHTLLARETNGTGTNYKTFSQHIATGRDAILNTDCQLLIARNNDLFMIWPNGTVSGKTEVHILTAKSGYLITGGNFHTGLGEVGDNYQFLIGSNRDLYCINKNGANSTDLHILTAASNYLEFTTPNPVPTAFGKAAGNLTCALTQNDNLVGFLKENTGSKMTELHLLNADQTHKRPYVTGLHEVGDNFTFLLSQDSSIIVVKENETGTDSTEVHRFDEISGYKIWALQTGTSLYEVNKDKPILKEGEVALYSGINQTGSSWKINNDLSDLSSLSSLEAPFYSMDLGLKTGLNVYLDKYFKGPEHTYITKENLGGVSFDSIKLWGNESLIESGISYSSLMTEDYHYPKDQPKKLTEFTSFQTIISFPPNTNYATIYGDQEVAITVNDIEYSIDNVKSQRFPLQAGEKLIITTPVTKLGTSYYRVNTNMMGVNENVLIFPDAHLHNKIADLPAGSLEGNREKISLASNISSTSCNDIQSALSNIAKSVTYPAGDNPFQKKLNDQSMEHHHWSIDLSPGNQKYTQLTKLESANILAGSLPLNGNGVTGILDSIGKDIVNLGKITLHTISHIAKKVENSVVKIAHEEEEKAKALYHSAIQTCIDLEDGKFKAAASSVESGLSDVAAMGSDIAHGPLTVIDSAMPTALVEKAVFATLHFADEAVSFVISHTGVVGEIIGFVIKKIGATIDKAVDWLRNEIGLDDVTRIQLEYNKFFNSVVQEVPELMYQQFSNINESFEHIRKKINTSFQAIDKELGMNPVPIGKSESSEVSHRIAWLTGKLAQHISSAKLFPYDVSGSTLQPSGVVKDYLVAVERLGISSLTHSFSDISSAIGKTVSDPEKTPEILLQTTLDVINQGADDFIDIAQLTGNFINDQATNIFQDVHSEVNRRIEITFLSDFYKLISPQPFTILNLSTLFPAIAVTSMDKNFGKGQSLKLNTDSSVKLANGLIFGINTALIPLGELGVLDKTNGKEKQAGPGLLLLYSKLMATVRFTRNSLHFYTLLKAKSSPDKALKTFVRFFEFGTPLLGLLETPSDKVPKPFLIACNYASFIGNVVIGELELINKSFNVSTMGGILAPAQTSSTGLLVYADSPEVAVYTEGILGTAIVECSFKVFHES
jgi:hypothetical protein